VNYPKIINQHKQNDIKWFHCRSESEEIVRSTISGELVPNTQIDAEGLAVVHSLGLVWGESTFG
jgi:hypothetical protein